MRLGLSAFLTLVTCAAFAPSAAAQQTLKVPSVAFPTIASAVAAANSGDTIQIAANNAPGSFGVYSEIIVVPNTKTGLIFKGSNVIWDGGTGDQLTFTGPNNGVTVEGIIFRNGTNQLTITGDNATVTKCVFLASGSDAVTITGNFATVSGIAINCCFDNGVVIVGTDAIVEKSSFTGIDFPGVRLTTADRALVTGCKFVRTDNGVLLASGNDVKIIKNTFDLTGNDAINASGDRLTVDGNKFLQITGEAIQLLAGSDDAVINNNSIDQVSNYAIFVNGAHATITKNKINHVRQGGIRIDNGNTALVAGPTISGNSVKNCITDDGIRVAADSATILSNTVDRIGDYNEGISMSSLGVGTQGGSVANNKVSNVHESGIRVTADSVAVSQNSVSKCGGGYDGSGAIRIVGNSCTLVGNKVSDIAGDGFEISGNTNTLTDCTATKCSNDGIDLESGNGNTIDGCSASACLGEGFDNSTGVTGTIIQNSTFSKCRIDFAGNGTLATDVNNTFTTGGAATAPAIDLN